MHARRLSFLGILGLLAGVLILGPVAWADSKDEWNSPLVLKDQKGTGWFLAFSPDGKILATASGGYNQQTRRKLPNSVRLWDVETHKLIRTLVADGPMVVGLAFTSDGKQLVAAGYDGSLRRLDVASGKEVDRARFGDRMGSVQFSPDRKLVLLVRAKPKPGQFLLQNEYQLREVDTGKIVTPDKPFPSEPVLAMGPDAQALVITVMQPSDPRIKLPPGASPLGGPLEGRLWDARTGKQSEALLKGTLTGALFSPDGKRILLTNLDLTGGPGAIHFWSVADEKLSPEKIPLKQNLGHFAFADDNSLLAAVGDDRTIRLFETTKMKEVASLKGGAGSAEAVLFAPDGKTLAAAHADGTIRLWTRKSP